MQLALGRTVEEEQKTNFSKISQLITGSRGILFTEKTMEEVKEFFDTFRSPHYARSGFVCSENYKLAAGTLPADRCPHPLEPQLRKLGLPTKLNQGRIELLNDVQVTKRGDILTPEQCKLLQIFGVKLAEFKVKVRYAWNQGRIKEIETEEEDDENESEEKGGEESKEELEGEEDEFGGLGGVSSGPPAAVVGIELRTAGTEDAEPFNFDEDDGGMDEAMEGGQDGEEDEDM